MTCSPHFVGAGPCHFCREYVSAVPKDPSKRLHLIETEGGLVLSCPKCCPVHNPKQDSEEAIKTLGILNA